jgi:hypothetical protein
MKCQNCETNQGTVDIEIQKGKRLILCLPCYSVIEELIELRKALRGK